jgi:DNA/RNA endonuclease G (NUC1)
VTLLLDGNGRRELRDILLAAFTRSKLEHALAEANPAHEFAHLVKEAPFDDQVAELVDAAEREGWLGQLESLLADELPERKDLHERLARVLRAAAAEAKTLGNDTTPTISVRGRLLTVAGIGLALGVLGAVLGILAYRRHSSADPWPLVLGVIALSFAAAFAVLLVLALSKDRVGDRLSAFARSKLPIACWIAIGALVVANGYWLAQGERGGRPNFILKLIEQTEEAQRVVADQPVELHELVGPGEEDRRFERTTDINGEAFFTLQLGSGIIYSGGVVMKDRDPWRDCVFPAFPVLEERSVVLNIAALNCSQRREGERGLQNADAVLRISSEFANSGPLPADSSARLPRDPAQRAQRAPLGVPNAPVVIDRRYYSVGYDPDHRTPLWTAFTVEAAVIAAGRGIVRFVRDPDLPRQFQSDPSDYLGNPYDRGHLVSAQDARAAGPEAEREVHFLTAVVPQAPETNRSVWYGLERYTRELAGRLGPIHVLSGPIYSGGQMLVIGPGETPVPIALYRVLLRADAAGQWRALAFVVLNDGSIGEFEPQASVLSVRKLETRTGLIFFPNLADRATAIKDTVDVAAFSE